MMEQIINESEAKTVGRALKCFKYALLLLLVLCVSGCIPQGDEQVNTELFKNKDEVATSTQHLHRGMSEKTVFAKLKINPARFDRMSMQEVQMAVYGNSQVRGTPEQLEAFRQRLSHYAGYSLPYRNLESSSSIGFGNMKITKKGCDLRLVLVFDRGKLIRATVEGTQAYRQVNDENLWPSILGRGIGLLHF